MISDLNLRSIGQVSNVLDYKHSKFRQARHDCCEEEDLGVLFEVRGQEWTAKPGFWL